MMQKNIHEGEKNINPMIVESHKAILQNFIKALKWFIFNPPQTGEQAGLADGHEHLTST